MNIFNFKFFSFKQTKEIPPPYEEIQREGTTKLPVLDELHEHIFSFLDEKSQQNAVAVNKFWCEIGTKAAKSSQIVKVENFMSDFVSNLDKQQFEIKEDCMSLYEQSRAQLADLSIGLSYNDDFLTLTQFKHSLKPVKESIVWNLNQIRYAMTADSVKKSFQLLKIKEPLSLKNYFELAEKDYKCKLAKGDPKKLSKIAFECLKMREFDRAFTVACKIHDNNLKEQTCFNMIKSLVLKGDIEKAKDLEKGLTATEILYLPSIPIYYHYKRLGNREMAKEYENKIIAHPEGAVYLTLHDLGL